MAQKVYMVEGRQFRTESDYARAKHDKEIIDRLRTKTNFRDKKDLEILSNQLRSGKYKFMTLLGQDFQEEVEALLKDVSSGKKGRSGSAAVKKTGQKSIKKASEQPEKISEAAVAEALQRQEKQRKLMLRISRIVAILCLGYFGVYSYYNYKTESAFQQMNELKEGGGAAAATPAASAGPLYTLDDAVAEREVLEEYKKLLNNNKKLIGWIKIDDTNINYPVLQTDNNEYYLDHNVNEEYDINGSIFMDKDCDIVKPSTNYILYGHHMKNGKMFGKLDSYQSESYYKEHPYISFDTIYEKGTYEVMYVFRSRVYKETEIVFKYYQFIDANGEQEFESHMQEMAAMSLYDTGVTASYGDQLLTLSTCDYQETDGRFVVVAKKIAKE
ncbi:MAG: class B sortase [Lachnospiraceae bacterium]|nr:class B sortase [Lachnospiraceae bacterium]